MPKKPHRIIVDTNLWISFLLTRDFARLGQLISSDKVTLLFSLELLDEFVAVAQRPKFRKYFSLLDLQQLLEQIETKAAFITVTSVIDLCRDSKDNFLLALVLDG
ncbi:MAG: putative toxin-antitoxin system toxin component, PIN family [Bacteroidota bacterium]|nr:putative toxin-antitoxin system toxin component, PIN family [Bacteroidota bacterium]